MSHQSDKNKIEPDGLLSGRGQDDSLRSGEIVGGRYEVLSVLGRGGMGLVYRVKQIFLGKEFALKIIEKRCMSDIVVRRFQQEARTTFALKHPGIIAVNDFGQLDDQTPFLVMEIIVGETLGDSLKKRVRLSLEEAIPIFVLLCKSLAYAHEQGVIHRDIKPNNIMLLSDIAPGTEGSVKILDFGIAKFVNHEGGEIQALTQTGDIFGSPLYMSPEQCTGAIVDYRSDIYSLGCVLYETLTGASPFRGENALRTMMMHQSEKALPLKDASLGENFSQPIEDIVATMLAKSPDDRYQDLHTVSKDLQALLKGETISQTAERSRNRQPELTAAKSKKSALIVGLLALLSIIIGVVAISYYHNNKTQVASISESVPVVPPSSGVVPIPENGESSIAPSKPFAKTSLKEAQSAGKPWLLQFPIQTSLGKLSVANHPPIEAESLVTIDPAQPLSLTPSAYLCEQPKLFRLFRQDEVESLIFRSHSVEVNDDLLLFINHLTGLKCLMLDKADISNDGLGYLSKLKSLKRLELSGTKVTGSGFASLSLKHLEVLKAEHLADASHISTYLNKCSELRELSLTSDNLNDDDLKNIAECSNLELLHLGGNKNITERGVEYLVKLKALKNLDLFGCNISEKSVKSFEKMHLTALSINPEGWSNKSIYSLGSLFLTPDFKAKGHFYVPDKYHDMLFHRNVR